MCTGDGVTYVLRNILYAAIVVGGEIVVHSLVGRRIECIFSVGSQSAQEIGTLEDAGKLAEACRVVLEETGSGHLRSRIVVVGEILLVTAHGHVGDKCYCNEQHPGLYLFHVHHT